MFNIKSTGGLKMSSRLLLGVAVLAVASVANANVTWTWSFVPSSATYTSGSKTFTVTDSASHSESVTVYAAQNTVPSAFNNENNSTGTLSTANTTTLNGLFQ